MYVCVVAMERTWIIVKMQKKNLTLEKVFTNKFENFPSIVAIELWVSPISISKSFFLVQCKDCWLLGLLRVMIFS